MNGEKEMRVEKTRMSSHKFVSWSFKIAVGITAK